MTFNCRHCKSPLTNQIIDLGNQPPSNSYLNKDQILMPEITYPLKVFLCSKCWLTQIPEFVKPKNLFTPEYAYFSSTSSSWCLHAKKYVNLATSKLSLNKKSFVLEIASNDGYLLQYFKEMNVNCLGIEPTIKTAEESEKKGIKTIKKFFGEKLSKELKDLEIVPKKGCDLIIANNVLAHVPDINDFIKGITNVLSENGTLTLEFPHLLKLLKYNQFDTIYHEHYSYLSLNFLKRICTYFGLHIYDVEEINTHGGSLRVWISKNKSFSISEKVENILKIENNFGIETTSPYESLQGEAEIIKLSLLEYLIGNKKKKISIAGYGAAAKANTLLNFSGVKSDLITMIADKAKSKQNLYMPGSHIPIVSPEKLVKSNIDEYIVFPWNLINEISNEFKDKSLITFIPNKKKWT